MRFNIRVDVAGNVYQRINLGIGKQAADFQENFLPAAHRNQPFVYQGDSHNKPL
jgi:hypothetical protein